MNENVTLTPGVNQQVVDAIFAFVEKYAPGFLVPVLEIIRAEIDSFLPQLSDHLDAQGIVTLSPADLQEWVDAFFAFVETNLGGGPLVVWALKAINGVLDSVGLPALVAWLVFLGILTV